MRRFILLFCIFGSVNFLFGQEATTKTYVIETFSNSCLIDVGGGIIDQTCTEADYPYSDSSNSNIRYKVQPDGNKSAWGVFQVSADGTKTRVNNFFLGTSQANADNSYVDVETGEIYLHTSEGYTIYNPNNNSLTLNSKNGYVSSSNGVIFRDVSISDLIREESDGAIHIGENSLVTIEQDGKQQLYATDANGDQIDINIKKGSDLLVDGKSVSQAITDVATNKTNIATNKTNIATNTTNIATNTQAITSLGTRVDGLTNLVNTFDQRITDLQTLTGTMMSEYRSGIASSVALSQIRYASKGFSIGVGQGEFKDKDEMAVGISYGGEFNDRVGYQFQFGSSGDTSGFGFTITF